MTSLSADGTIRIMWSLSVGEAWFPSGAVCPENPTVCTGGYLFYRLCACVGMAALKFGGEPVTIESSLILIEGEYHGE